MMCTRLKFCSQVQIEGLISLENSICPSNKIFAFLYHKRTTQPMPSSWEGRNWQLEINLNLTVFWCLFWILLVVFWLPVPYLLLVLVLLVHNHRYHPLAVSWLMFSSVALAALLLLASVCSRHQMTIYLVPSQYYCKICKVFNTVIQPCLRYHFCLWIWWFSNGSAMELFSQWCSNQHQFCSINSCLIALPDCLRTAIVNPSCQIHLLKGILWCQSYYFDEQGWRVGW